MNSKQSVKRQLKKNGNILGKPHHRQICSRHYPSDCLIVSDSRTKPGLKNENKHELPTLHLDRKKPNQTGNGIEVSQNLKKIKHSHRLC